MIVLASASSARQKLLRDAGVEFVTQVSQVNEVVAKQKLQHLSPPDQAIQLAQQKTAALSSLRPQDVIIGADQILELQGTIFNKPVSLTEAFEHLTRLQGKTHHLHSAAVTMVNGTITFQVVQTVAMTMRTLDANAISSYLANAGPDILGAVGCYQIEKIGIQLFDDIAGDYFSILGLPLMPLLKHLRLTNHFHS